MFGGIRIIESLDMVDHVEDWSRVRSPGRARRRRHKHRQNIKIVAVPKKEAISIDHGRALVMHPVLANELRRNIKTSVDRDVEQSIYGGHRAPMPGMLTGSFVRMSPWHRSIFGVAVT